MTHQNDHARPKLDSKLWLRRTKPSRGQRSSSTRHQAPTVHSHRPPELLTLAAPTTQNDHYLDHCSGNNDSSGDSGSPMGVPTDKKRGKLHEQQHE
jgi:hypothetical protein